MKKTIKNLLTGLTALAMATSATGVSVQAISMNTSKDATLAISNTCASPGQLAKISVTVGNNPGFAGLGAIIGYDSSLEIVDNEQGKVTSMLTVGTDDGVAAIGAVSNNSVNQDGTIVDLYFKVPENAEVGTVYNVSWNRIDQFVDKGNVECNNITIDGSIKVIDNKPTFGNEEIKLDDDDTATELEIFNGSEDVIFASNDDKIVTVKDGKLVPVGKGIARVYALVGDVVLSCSVNVGDDAEATVDVKPVVDELRGNVNLDTKIDSIDAATVLKYYTLSMKDKDLDMGSAMNFGDVNKDGKIDSIDAASILKFYTLSMKNPDVSWDSIIKS